MNKYEEEFMEGNIWHWVPLKFFNADNPTTICGRTSVEGFTKSQERTTCRQCLKQLGRKDLLWDIKAKSKKKQV